METRRSELARPMLLPSLGGLVGVLTAAELSSQSTSPSQEGGDMDKAGAPGWATPSDVSLAQTLEA